MDKALLELGSPLGSNRQSEIVGSSPTRVVFGICLGQAAPEMRCLWGRPLDFGPKTWGPRHLTHTRDVRSCSTMGVLSCGAVSTAVAWAAILRTEWEL